MVKKILKLKKRHPKKEMRMGRHIISMTAKEFDLNDEELKELTSKGGKAWFMEVKKAPKKEAKKEVKKEKK